MKKLFPFLFILLASCGGNPVAVENRKVDTEKHDSFKIKMTGVEKMLSEKMVDVPADSNMELADTIVDEFRFVLNNQFIVLSAKIDTSLATGDPEKISDDNYPTAVVKNCNMAIVSEKDKQFIGRKFHLISIHGKQFDVKISKLKVLAEYYPNYGNADDWDALHPNDTLGIAQWAWNYSIYSRMLVGEIDTVFSDNDSLLGAIPFELGKPEFYKPTFNETLEDKAKEDIKSTIQYQAIQKNYINSESVKKSEGEWIDDLNNEFYFSGKSKSKQEYYNLCIDAGPMCDEGFYAEISAVWKTSLAGSSAKNELEFCYPGFFYAAMYFDMDGDGVPEIFAYDYSNSPIVFKKVKGKWKLLTHIYIDDERCNC